MEIPIIGGAYADRSTDLNAQACINLFPIVDKQDGKKVLSLRGTPGIVQFANPLGSAALTPSSLELLAEDSTNLLDEEGENLLMDVKFNVRAMLVANGSLYCVIYSSIYKVESDGSATLLGAITTLDGFVTMESNSIEILIADGTNYGYLITLADDSVNLVTSINYPVTEGITFQDGYFIAVEKGSGKWYISSLYDGQTWGALDFTTAESKPDNALLPLSTMHDVWIFGETSIEGYFNSGNVDFPFERINGSSMDIGCGAVGSPIRIDGVMYFLSNKGQVCKLVGYEAVPISTAQVDYQISTYTLISDALSLTYSKDGHSFYVLTFPSAECTWVYDITTGFWHEWLSYTEIAGTAGRHRCNRSVQFGLDWIIGDYSNGLLYKLKMDTYTDNLQPIVRQRVTQTTFKERTNIIHHSLTLDFEAGVGVPVCVDPQVILEWSDNGGHTWSNQHSVSMGTAGSYTKRAKWNRLGKSRNRVYKITIADPVKVNILGAYAELEACTA
jgi:hypothetical protein